MNTYNLKSITIKNARENNLKNINLNIPKNKLTVITGPSGSGKSTIAINTIYAESQRRYVENLSAYPRQFIKLMPKPKLDYISGLSPSILIERKRTEKNPRSTVGTLTEIYDYLRLLFSRIGTPYSPITNKPIKKFSVAEIVDFIIKIPKGTKVHLLSPIIRNKRGDHKLELITFKKKGFERLKINGKIFEIDVLSTLDSKNHHNISILVDRIIIKEGIKQRITNSVETILSLSNGFIELENIDTKETTIFSTKLSCPISDFTIDKLEPTLFSFNNPLGACPSCKGLGDKITFDPDLIIPNTNLTINQSAIVPWANSYFHIKLLESLLSYYKENKDLPFNKLKEHTKNVIIYGSKNNPIKTKKGELSHFEGIIQYLHKIKKETKSKTKLKEISSYQRSITCKVCNGSRLQSKSLSVKIQGLNIYELSKITIKELHIWLKDLPQKLNKEKQQISKPILRKINQRLNFLINIGLEYLNLSRKSTSLSSGESQRIKLISLISSELTGMIYILDEPSIGLHQKDSNKLLSILNHLKKIGNTILLVEHDKEIIINSDYVIDLGPKAGKHGGEIMAFGTSKEIISNKHSITGQYLNNTKKILTPTIRRNPKKFIQIIGANKNNLKNLNVNFPLNKFVCITGVSGSGKSSLIIDTLYKLLKNKHTNSNTSIKGAKQVNNVKCIDQSSIGSTPKSNPVTYIGVFKFIRELFSKLTESKIRGYSSSRFSFNLKSGYCDFCKGNGQIRTEMHFLPDIYIKCEKCNGTRYNKETLEIKYKNKSIADVLNMNVEESLKFFKSIPIIHNKLQGLSKVGLSYIKLGQSATTLSSGEAQRIKLAKELCDKDAKENLYILDEPTTGLHLDDINNLIKVLQKLVDNKNTVIVIEHNLDLIKTADWIIDLGPEGGHKGGKIIAKGKPEQIIKNPNSYTGKFLKKYL